jgi:4-coumarate--CoA ligase
MKELIKVKGNQVAPAELEALLLEHPQIADAAVVGVTIGGEEIPRAYVVLQPGEKGEEREVQEWLAKRVSRYKRLTGGVVFVDTVPKNPVCSPISPSRGLLTKHSPARFCARS